jgi:NitT/TauT family transport system permease protein
MQSSSPDISELVALDPMIGVGLTQAGWRRWLGHISPWIWLARLGVLIGILVLWDVAVKQEWINPIYAATPAETFDALKSMLTEGKFWSDLLVTLREALLGFAIGSALGLVVGLILGRWVAGAKVFSPYLTFVNAIPKIALAPIFILWFGIGETSKVVTAALVVFFIVQVPTMAAVALTNPDLDTVATTMGANERQKFLKVYLPGILAALFGALRLAAVLSLLTVVFAEFIAAQAGLGQRLIGSTNKFAMDEAFAIMIVLAVLALAINGVVGIAERHFLRWQSSDLKGSVVSL